MAARRKKSGEEYWREQINGLSGPFPEVGRLPPELEVIPQDIRIRRGKFTKMSFDVYLFTDIEDNRSFMISNNQKMWDFGEMTLPEAIVKAKRRGGTAPSE